MITYTKMFHQEVEEVEEVEEVAPEEEEAEKEEETELKVVAEDKMPSKLLRLPMTISQLCEPEDLFDLIKRVA